MLTLGHRIVRTLKLPIIFEKVCPFRPNFAFCSQEKLSRNTKHSSEKPSRQQIRSMLPRNSSNWDDSIVEICKKTNKVWLTSILNTSEKETCHRGHLYKASFPYVLKTYSYSSHIRSSDFPQQAKIVRRYVENSSYTGVLIISTRIFDNVIAKWTFCVQQFFFDKKLSPK